MSQKIAILGAGPGGYVAAVRAAQMGAEVTVIEKDNVGGTCLNRGCIPSKVMIKTAEMLGSFRRAAEFGIKIDGSFSPDITALMDRKKKVIDAQSRGILGLLKHHKIEYLKGRGCIEAPGKIIVKQEDESKREVRWDSLIIATGTQTLSIPGFPFDGERILSSNHILNLKKIPESILIVGGGVIGCEFAFILKSLGTEVTLVEGLSRLLPLPSVDQDCSKVLMREMKKHKIKFMVDRTVEKVETHDGKNRVTIGTSPFTDASGSKPVEPQAIDVEKVLICIGRKPNTSGLGLSKIGLKPDDRGWISVNDRMKTDVPGVFAIGDVLGPEKVMLAHVASTEGMVAAENVMGGSEKMDYSAVPGAIFTMPEVANVGLTEAQAKEALPENAVRADTVLFRTLGKAQVIGEIAGQAKIVSNAETGKVLGVHIIGPHATDLIAEGVLAVQTGCTVKDLAKTIHAHPTLAEVMLEASFKALDRSLHG